MIGVSIEDFTEEEDVEKHPEAWIIGYAGPIHGSDPPCPWLVHLYLKTTQKDSITASQVALVVKNSSANAGDVKRGGFHPCVGKIPWRREWRPTPVFLSGESHGQRSLVGYSPCDHKESDTTEAT